MISKDVRRAETDRRSPSNRAWRENGNTESENRYAGPERRSGKDRREWVDRMLETRLKIKSCNTI